MLRNLHVRNLAVIAEAAIEFGPGLNVVTGETGAGKSLVVDSLGLLAGARASTDLIRTGAEVCTVTGVFEPPSDRYLSVLGEAGVSSDEGELVIRRELTRTGPNRIFINDQPVTLRLLGAIAPLLMRIHGQREELSIALPGLQRRWLDLQGGENARSLLAKCAEAHSRWDDAARRLERIVGDDRLRHERIDLLRFQINEIESARPEPGEEVALRGDRELLRHAEAIGAGLATAIALISDDDEAASARVARARAAMAAVAQWQPDAESWRGELEEVGIRLDELADSMRRALERVDSEPGQLDAAEERLATLERLFRKYGATSEQVLEHLETSRRELDELDADESQREELQQAVAEALGTYLEVATRLSRGRRKWAKALIGKVECELAELALAKARFEVSLDRRPLSGSPLRVGGEEIAFGVNGYDVVTFEFASNPGEEKRPLSRVASGGELARVYLALQVAARGDGGPAAEATLVFDEVDAGIGGQEAAAVGRKLRRLAQGGQILAVTHLPQVASFGNQHLRVLKRVVGERTTVSVEGLGDEHRVEEVARMLAGEEVTELSRSHAQELLAGGNGD